MRNIYLLHYLPFRTALNKSFTLIFASLLLSFTLYAQAPGNALSYDGVDDYVTLPNNFMSTVSGDFTVEAWVYWTGSNNSFPRILEIGTDANNFIMFSTAIPFGSTGPRFGIMESGVPQAVDASAALVNSTWNHIAVTLDNATNTAKIYVNGVLSGTTTGFTFRPSDLTTTTINWIGRSQSGTDVYYQGIIDELRISNVVRYSSNFTPTHSEFVTDANTLALYHFDEGTGQTSVDASGVHTAATLGATTSAESTDPAWITNSILPVHLSSFTVSANSNLKAVDINWTASMDQSGEYQVERSINGSVFTSIGTVSVSGGGNTQSYTFRDAHPLAGRSYYRLKCLENGSAPLFSRTASVQFGMANGMLVYPNPAMNKEFNIELASPVNGEVSLQLVNSAGIMLYNKKITAKDQNIFKVNPGMLPAGNYWIRLKSNDIQQSSMILFQ